MKTCTYDEAGLAIGRGTKGGTLKDFKQSLDRMLKRKGWHQKWSRGPGRRRRGLRVEG